MQQSFSVIIPTLNEEFYLPYLLKDLCRQKDTDFEVLIIDSNSTDNTKKVIQDYKKQLSIRFYQVDKNSVSYQRNFGAKKALGSYLIFIDADCRVSSSFIKVLHNRIKHQSGLVFIPYIEPDGTDTQHKLLFQFVNFLIDVSQVIGKPFSSGGCMIWESNFFNTVGGFDEKLYIAEDHHIIQKALQWGVHAKFFEDVKVKLSLRRLQKEGHLASMYKYLMATAHVFFKGDIKTKIFEYEMGGHQYNNKAKRYLEKQNNKEFWKDQLKQINRLFNNLLSD